MSQYMIDNAKSKGKGATGRGLLVQDVVFTTDGSGEATPTAIFTEGTEVYYVTLTKLTVDSNGKIPFTGLSNSTDYRALVFGPEFSRKLAGED